MRVRSLLLVGLSCGLVFVVSCQPLDPLSSEKATRVESDRSGPPYDSGPIPLAGGGQYFVFALPDPIPSETDVAIGLIVSADLGAANESIRLGLNDITLGTVLASGGIDCAFPAQEVQIMIPAETFNASLQAKGQIEIIMLPSAAVDLAQCPSGYIRCLVDYCGSGTCPAANPVPGPPRVVSAISTGNTSVRVTFNEPVFEHAASTASYSIVQANVNSESAALRVDGAELSQDMTIVTLTTASQNEVTYELIVTGIQDLAGNVIAAPDILVNPTRTQFAGTPPVNGGPDSDEDGLSDALEQNGWVVNVRRVNGDVDSYTVTSDPTLEDTDADGVFDADEFRNRSDPRRDDTDGETLSDSEEWNITFSDLTSQDSDEDGIDDNLEVALYKTSPTLADTDGDGLSDSREVVELFRDPRIADLPRPRITVGQVRLALDERYSFVNEEGESTSVESSSSTALAESENKSYSYTDSDTTGSAREAFIKGNIEAEISKDPSLTIGAEGGYKWNWSDSYTDQWTQESSEASQRTYEESLNKGRQFSRTNQVTREVLGASLSADVTIQNAGEIAFSITNLEVTVLQRSPFSLNTFDPVATLLPASALTSGNDLVLNLGPLVPERGPFIFSDREIFPILVEELMSSPRGLTFKIANFDITDEFGRNFAFSSQEARDHGAGIVIDRGDGEPERILVALNGQVDDREFAGGGFIGGFDARGRPLGLPMDYVLQDILGLTKNRRAPDSIVAGQDFLVSTPAAGDDVQVVPNGTAGLLPQDVIVTAGLNGVLDSTPQGDDRPEVTSGYETSPTCGTLTPEQIIEPIQDGDGVASSAARDDDVQIIGVGQPAAAGAQIIAPGPDGVIDSFPDGDDHATFPGQTGKPDGIAEPPAGGDGVAGTTAEGDDEQLIPVGAPVDPAEVIIGPGPNGFIDTIPAPDDVLVSRDCGNHPMDGREVLVRFENRRSGDFQRVWLLLVDRNLPIGVDFGKLLLKPGDDVSIAFIQDQDRDGLIAQEEFAEHASDIDDDSDDDELDDFAEVRVGWTVGITGGLLSEVRPAPSLVDSDGDGLADWYEQDLRRLFSATPGLLPEPNPANLAYITPTSTFQTIFGFAWTDPSAEPEDVTSANPRLADSDGDGLSDRAELYSYTVGSGIRAGANDIADTQALGDDVQKTLVGLEAFEPPGATNGGVVILPGPNLVIDSVPAGDDVTDNGSTVRTNPLNPDHDGDTRPDGQERDLGGNPTNPNDSDDFRDTDRDGLSDAEEAALGWIVEVNNPSCPPELRAVFSNKFVPDTDLDGLPDLLERLIGSDPTRDDTDCDGLLDFDEFGSFELYVDLALQYPGFELNGTGSQRYGTNLNDPDTDGDTLSDPFELNVGWRVNVLSESVPREVRPSPLFADTDGDLLTDPEELLFATDPRDTDTDDDDRIDGRDVSRCSTTNAVCGVPGAPACGGTCAGSNPLLPDISVTITYEFVRIVDEPDAHPGGDPHPNSWDWLLDLGVRVPGRLAYTTLINELTADTGCVSQYCGGCEVSDTVLPFFYGQQSLTVVMYPGDVLILEGHLAEIYNCPFGESNPTLYGDARLLEARSFDQVKSDGTSLEVHSLLDESGILSGSARVLIQVN